MAVLTPRSTIQVIFGAALLVVLIVQVALGVTVVGSLASAVRALTVSQ